jgi:GT2 family glycosyltransferase
MFDLAIILINYNSSEFTIPCLEKIYKKTSNQLSFQVIVVDNCSTDNDYQKVLDYCTTSSFPNLSIYQTPINCGFGQGNNAGFGLANATYVAFLNNDTLLLNDCFSVLIAYLKQHPKVGMVGAQAFKENGDFMVSLDHFASPTREIMGRSFLELIAPATHPKRKKQHQKPVKVDFVPGSFMLLRSADFIKAGQFDPALFLYYEETDLCLRLQKLGLSTFLVPEAQFVHYHGASTGKSMAIKKEIKISLLYVLRKHYGNWGMQLVRLFLILKYGLSSIIKSKNRELLKLVWMGAPLSASLQHQQVPRKQANPSS